MFEYSLKAGLYKMRKESQLLTLCYGFVTFRNKGYVHIQIYTQSFSKNVAIWTFILNIHIPFLFSSKRWWTMRVYFRSKEQYLFVILTAAVVLSFWKIVPLIYSVNTFINTFKLQRFLNGYIRVGKKKTKLYMIDILLWP